MTGNSQRPEGLPVPWSPPTYQESCNPRPTPPATAGASYHAYAAPPSIEFEFHPVPQSPRADQPWFGRLSIKTENVPLLMKDGFAITPESILREEGCVKFTTSEPEEEWMKEKWPYTRHYFLRDPNTPIPAPAQQQREEGGGEGQETQIPPRWMAHMQCFAANFEALAQIRLCELTHHQVDNCTASARGGKGPRIYHFDRLRARESINCIYDDLPLEGLWPYPKSQEGFLEGATRRQRSEAFISCSRA
ncbi:hypothetical protein PG997_001770 [Apiospora hydei]|uniref:Uncharacterized protein n=1 Tax=Apiospora hydei TaxID=1337664 RepID=A0ABR1XEI4_9PEZI